MIIIRCRMKKTRSLKARRYAARLIDLDEYLDSLPGDTLADKIGITEFNEILLNGMTNIWSKQDCVQCFDYESILFKKAVKLF